MTKRSPKSRIGTWFVDLVMIKCDDYALKRGEIKALAWFVVLSVVFIFVYPIHLLIRKHEDVNPE